MAPTQYADHPFGFMTMFPLEEGGRVEWISHGFGTSLMFTSTAKPELGSEYSGYKIQLQLLYSPCRVADLRLLPFGACT